MSMMMPPHRPWFSEHPELAIGVGALLKFPDQMQSIIAEGISVIAERDFNADTLYDNLKSIGSDRILAFYKGRRDNQAFNHNPELYKALNYVLILPDVGRREIAFHIIRIKDNFVEYLVHCKNINHDPHFDEFRNLVQVYVVYGPLQAEKVLLLVKETGAKVRQSTELPMHQMIEGDLDTGLMIVEAKPMAKDPPQIITPAKKDPKPWLPGQKEASDLRDIMPGRFEGNQAVITPHEDHHASISQFHEAMAFSSEDFKLSHIQLNCSIEESEEGLKIQESSTLRV